MRSHTQRAQQRVPYPVDVHLHAPAQSRAARGRSINLSASGIFVQANEAFDVGTKVICELPLPGGMRHLAGMVARLQPLANQAAGVGLGIRFIDLDRAAEGLLRNLVADAEPRTHAVNVRFEGLERELRSQAVLTGEGIRLQTALPFLAPGTEVAVAFLAGPSQVLSHGLIHDVRVDVSSTDGTPRLLVNLQMPSRLSAVDRLFHESEEVTEVTAVESPRALASAASAQVAAAGASSTAATAPAVLTAMNPNSGITRRIFSRSARRPLRARGRSRLRASSGTLTAVLEQPAVATAAAPTPIVRIVRGAAIATLGLGLVAFGAGITYVRLRPPPRTETITRLPAPDKPPAVATARTPAPAPEPAPKPTPAATPAPTPTPTPAATSEPAPTPTPTATPAPTPTTTAELDPPAMPPSASEVRDRRPGLVLAGVPAGPIHPPPLPEDTTGPEMRLENGFVTGVVPIRGSIEGMTQFRVEEPQGVVINLPHAEAVLPLGRHAVYNEGFRFVWIRVRDEGGIQVRFQLAYRTPEIQTVDVTPEAVLVRVAPPAPPKG